MKHLVHGVVVITSNLRVGDPAIPLCGFNARVIQQVLDGDQISIGVEHLRGHRMAKLMATDSQTCSAGIELHAMLDATSLQRFALKRPVLSTKKIFLTRE